MLKINLTCLVILYYFSSYFVIFIYTLLFLVILSVSEVSINLKREFVYLKRRFFTLNLRCVLKLWIFRSFHSLKMTSGVDISLTLNMTNV